MPEGDALNVLLVAGPRKKDGVKIIANEEAGTIVTRETASCLKICKLSMSMSC